MIERVIRRGRGGAKEWASLLKEGDVNPADQAVVFYSPTSGTVSAWLMPSEVGLYGKPSPGGGLRNAGPAEAIRMTTEAEQPKPQTVMAAPMVWGFPNPMKKGLIINARAETLLQKPMFKEAARSRRCVIAASGFYEWDSMKNKVTFEREDGAPIYMAGVYNWFEDRPSFVIITTDAGFVMSQVHDRMPLILEEEQIKGWVFDDTDCKNFLKKREAALQIREGYIQQTFDFS